MNGRALTTAAHLVTFSLTCAILYWGRAIFVPVALAVLLSFILNPIVRRLERYRLSRVGAVIAVAFVASLAIGSLLWLVTAQLSDLAKELPAKREIIKEKLADLRGMGSGGSIEVFQDTFESVSQEIDREEEAEAKANEAEGAQVKSPIIVPGPAMSPTIIPGPTMPPEVSEGKESTPIAVMVVPKSEILNWSSVKALTPVFASAGQIGLVFILVMLLLIAEEDLRGRLVSITGEARLAVTTNALQNAGIRISSYLSIQLLLNASYGLAVGLGLYIIGVPYAILWGVCAAVFRYIPYVGPWVAALLPLATALISSEGWRIVGTVVLLFVVLELISNNVIEPWLYGRSVGIPAFILLISAIFWTWLWGPVGLILSTPLTVCLVALGEHVEPLNFLARLLGAESQQVPHLLLYQRLLAHDNDGAEVLIDSSVTEVGSTDLYTAVDALAKDVVAPVLNLIKRDIILEALQEGDKDRILRFLDAKIEFLTEQHSHAYLEKGPVRLVLCPALDTIDETAARLLALVLKAGGASCAVVSHTLLASEVNELVSAERTRLVTVVAVAPGGATSAARICKRLCNAENGVEVAVNYWGDGDEALRTRMESAGADRVAFGLWGGHDLLAPLDQFYKSQEKAVTPLLASNYSGAPKFH